MEILRFLCVSLLFASALCVADDTIEDGFERVTCGSSIKLKHVSSGFHVHSHNIQWGSGSGQQSVTATEK